MQNLDENLVRMQDIYRYVPLNNLVVCLKALTSEFDICLLCCGLPTALSLKRPAVIWPIHHYEIKPKSSPTFQVPS